MMNRVIAPAIAALALASGMARADFKEERQSRGYQSAMADYSAGRLDVAVAGFEKVIKADGDNASARFQLASLLQDYRRDFMGAMCNYREYLRLEPSSDKAALATERMAICERELAKHLAEKYGLGGGDALARESERARAELAATEKKITEASKALEDAEKRMSGLEMENARLRRMVSSVGEAGRDESSDERPVVKIETVRELLDEDDDATAPTKVVAPVLDDEDDGEKIGRSLAEAKALLEEEDTDDSAPVLLDPNAPPAAQRLSDIGKKDEPESRQDYGRPETYVVQDGDTLYKIALRFYGKTSAWKLIRDANKATITTDGRVMSGQTIILP